MDHGSDDATDPQALAAVLEEVYCPRCRADSEHLIYQPLPTGRDAPTEDDAEGAVRWWWFALCDQCWWLGRAEEAATAHALTLPKWRAFLLTHWPDDFSEPEQAQYPTLCRPGTSSKVAVLAKRQERGLQLWHRKDKPGALILHQIDELAPVLDPGRNGVPLHQTTLRDSFPSHRRDKAQAPEDDSPPAWLDDSPDPPPPPGVMLSFLERKGFQLGNSEPRCPHCGWGWFWSDGRRLICRWCSRAVEQERRVAA